MRAPHLFALISVLLIIGGCATGTEGDGNPPTVDASVDVVTDVAVDVQTDTPVDTMVDAAPDVTPDVMPDVPDMPPECLLDCNDGIPCTVDACDESGMTCLHPTDDSLCPEGERCHATRGCEPPTRCISSSDCDDGVYCNGEERCDPMSMAADSATGCRPGVPIVCDDGVACTSDRCNEATRMCETLPADSDMDGDNPIGCMGGMDCDDSNPAINSSAPEVCNGLDDNCSGMADDGPGMGCAMGAPGAACMTACGTMGTQACTDCVLGGCVAEEVCNNCDDDGDGMTDEGSMCSAGDTEPCMTSCGTMGMRTCDADCGGFGACIAVEACNGCDDDADGMTDETFDCVQSSSGPCSTSCGTMGTQSCTAACTLTAACEATEVCNGCDDDGDGTADDGFTCAQGASESCTTSCGTAGTRSCNATCGGFDTCAAASETCGNGCDDDGNGTADDGCMPADPFANTCNPSAFLLESPGSYTGNTCGMSDSRNLTCNGSGVPDVWFRYSPLFILDSNINISLSSGYSIAFYGDSCSNAENGCLANGASVTGQSLGFWYFAVEKTGGGCGTFTLDISGL